MGPEADSGWFVAEECRACSATWGIPQDQRRRTCPTCNL